MLRDYATAAREYKLLTQFVPAANRMLALLDLGRMQAKQGAIQEALATFEEAPSSTVRLRPGTNELTAPVALQGSHRVEEFASGNSRWITGS